MSMSHDVPGLGLVSYISTSIMRESVEMLGYQLFGKPACCIVGAWTSKSRST